MKTGGKESRPLISDGVLVVDKPEGPTSHDVVTLARRALGVSRIGHTGTLDPMATGVLPLVVGKATRLAQFLTASEKTYEAAVAFGRTTNTYDKLGRLGSTSPARPSRQDVEDALARFRGTFEQTPPAFSAKNIDGERAYALARKNLRSGESSGLSRASDLPEPSRPRAVPVTVHQLELAAFDGETAQLTMRVSAGFYVRALAHDLGAALGCGAVLVALRRTRSGEFGVDDTVPLADLLQMPRAELSTRLIPMTLVMRDLPAVVLRGAASLERLKNGVEMGPADLLEPFTAPAAPGAPQSVVVRLLGPEGGLVALAKPGKEPGHLHGWVVLA
jgi:tRNA pseudouridine55 synthase